MSCQKRQPIADKSLRFFVLSCVFYISKRFSAKLRTGGLSVSVYPYSKRNEKNRLKQNPKSPVRLCMRASPARYLPQVASDMPQSGSIFVPMAQSIFAQAREIFIRSYSISPHPPSPRRRSPFPTLFHKRGKVVLYILGVIFNCPNGGE